MARIGFYALLSFLTWGSSQASAEGGFLEAKYEGVYEVNVTCPPDSSPGCDTISGKTRLVVLGSEITADNPFGVSITLIQREIRTPQYAFSAVRVLGGGSVLHALTPSGAARVAEIQLEIAPDTRSLSGILRSPEFEEDVIIRGAQQVSLSLGNPSGARAPVSLEELGGVYEAAGGASLVVRPTLLGTPPILVGYREAGQGLLISFGTAEYDPASGLLTLTAGTTTYSAIKWILRLERAGTGAIAQGYGISAHTGGARQMRFQKR